MTLAFSLILSVYCLLVLVLLMGWTRMRQRRMPGLGKIKSGISVIVACRNEEENIENLAHCFSALQYPVDKFEVILVDDHSTDKTIEKIKINTKDLPNFVLVQLQEKASGKKSALQIGISRSKFDIIATTDADCSTPPDWLSYLSLFFENEETKMVVGAVRFAESHSFFSRLQAMEFSSLVGTTAAAIALNHPVMSNGANLAIRKEAFEVVDGYSGNIQIPSGDDEFLMRKIFRRYSKGIAFMNFSESTVNSQPQSSIHDFCNQRLRWAGKWKHHSDILTRMLAVFILLSQITFVTLIIENIVYPDRTLFLVFFKILIESIFIFVVMRFLGLRFNWLVFIMLQIIYPVYVTGIGLYSLSGSYQWKQRNYK